MLPENKNGFSVSSSVAFSFSWWIKTFFPASTLCTAAGRFTSTKHRKHPDLDHEIESKLKWKYFCWTRWNCYYWVCVCARFSLGGFVGIEIRHFAPLLSIHRSLPTIVIISFVDRNACVLSYALFAQNTHRAVSYKRQKSGDLSGINFHFSLNSYLP